MTSDLDGIPVDFRRKCDQDRSGRVRITVGGVSPLGVASDDRAGGSPKWRRGIFGGAHRDARQRLDTTPLVELGPRVGEAVAHAGFGILAAVLVGAWVIIGTVTRFPGWWQTALYWVTGSVTFVMVFVIQHTQQRRIAATQRKLDELLRSSPTPTHTRSQSRKPPTLPSKALLVSTSLNTNRHKTATT